MKKIIFFLAGLLLISPFVFSQDTKQENKSEEVIHHHFFYGNPLGIFQNRFRLSLENDLKNHNSFMVMGNLILSKGNGESKSGGGGELHYRINMSKHPDKANPFVFFYFAPYMEYQYLQLTSENHYYQTMYDIYKVPTYYDRFINSVSGGLLMGVRLTNRSNRLAFNLYAGGGMKYSTNKFSNINGNSYYEDWDNTFIDPGYTGIVPKAGFQMGFSF